MAAPQAVLELSKSNILGWVSGCPDHGRNLKDGTWKGTRSSTVLGEQQDFAGKTYLVFRCKEKGGHTFNALKPKNAPRTREEVQAYMLKAKAAEAGFNPDEQKKGSAA